MSVLYYAVIEATARGSTRRQQSWGKGYATRREADQALRERVTAFDNQVFVRASRLSLGDYLTQQWLPLSRDRVKATTFNSYERSLVTYVLPRIGAVHLQELTPGHLNRLYAELRASGAASSRSAEGSLSPKTVRNVHAVLSKALNDAVDAGLLVANVANRAKPPRVRVAGQTADVWSAEELSAFLASVAADRLFAAWHLAAHTGLRRGELLGLRWQDVDESMGVASVRQAIVLDYTTPIVTTPKGHDARVVNLALETLEVLRDHRARQGAERQAWGEGYIDSGLVFRREDGVLINPDRLSQLFDKLVRRSGVRRIKLHGLRHTHASLMLKAGVPIKVVSERLGHADPAFTLRIYQHVLSGMQSEAAELFAETLRQATRLEAD
jgi:integrase